MRRPDSGQALLETCLSLMLLIPMLTGGGLVLKSLWNRWTCMRTVFTVTRGALERPPVSVSLRAGTAPVLLRRRGGWIEGSARCGRARETVRLPLLSPLPEGGGGRSHGASPHRLHGGLLGNSPSDE